MATVTLPSSASLLHNNLVGSSGGWLACVHNSVNPGGSMLMLHSMLTSVSKAGPEIAQATSIRYLEMPFGPVLCLTSINGTQIYNEDATTLLFYSPIVDQVSDLSKLKFHQGSCVVPSAGHVAIGTSKGSLVPVYAASAESFAALSESKPGSPTAEVTDLCYSAAANAVFSVHANGDMLVWAVTASGPYSNTAKALTGSDQVPIRIAPLGTRLAVAHGTGTICLFDALSHELQVEVTAHARWITGMAIREDTGQIASVGEDTVLNVWQVDMAHGNVFLQHSSVVTDKLLTGVALHGAGAAVSAYDSDIIHHVSF